MANAVIFRGDEAHVLDALTGLRTKRILIDNATNGAIVSGTTNTMTLEMAPVLGDRIVRIPDPGKFFSQIVVTEGPNTLNGSYTFTDNVTLYNSGPRRYIKFTGTTSDSELYCDYENTSVWWRNGLNSDNGTDNSYDVYDRTNAITRIELIPAGKGIIRNDVDFTDNVTIMGNLEVQGTQTIINTATLDVEDANITVNVGGTDATAEGAGVTVERVGTNGTIVYEDALTSKFKLGPVGSEFEVITAVGGQTIGGTLTVTDDFTVGFNALVVDVSTKSSTFGDVFISDYHTFYTGTSGFTYANPIQPDGTITFGNSSSGAPQPTIAGHSTQKTSLFFSALSFDANTDSDMRFDIRKPNGSGGTTALGNTGNVGWQWNNFGSTAMTLTRSGALTVGQSNISDRHTFYTGTVGTTFASPLQPDGTVTIGGFGGGVRRPVISGRSSDSIPLMFTSFGNDANTDGDMYFDIRKPDGAGGTTTLGNLGNIGWRWRNWSIETMALTREGALTVGQSNISDRHTFYTGTSATSYASPLQAAGTIIFGNSSGGSLTAPSIIGRSSDQTALYLGALSFDSSTFSDMIFDIRKDDGAGGTTALGNPGNIGWTWRNNATTSMTLTRGGALTVGNSNIPDKHTIYTGTSSTIFNPIQPDGTIALGNEDSGSPAPIISGRSDSDRAFNLTGIGNDSFSGGDMVFEIAKHDGTGGTTFLNNTSNAGWIWRNFFIPVMSVTRSGAITAGNSVIEDPHTLYTGFSGVSVLSSIQPEGSFGIGNGNSDDPAPVIVSRSDSDRAMRFVAIGNDSYPFGDMVFELRKPNGTGGTTSIGNTGNPGWRWRNLISDVAMELTRGGDLSVTGSISKGSGSFKIDHPLPSKTDTHHLIHSFVESPQADNMYRGKVTLVNGEAQVNIDTQAGMTEGTFEALNREVQCFTTIEKDWTPIEASVLGNIITIKAIQDPTSTAEVSWLVIGERKDKHMYDTAWTDSNGKPIIEPEKPQESENKDV